MGFRTALKGRIDTNAVPHAPRGAGDRAPVCWHRYLAGALALLLSATAMAQTKPSDESAATAKQEAAGPPPRNYSGDFWQRSTLTGDWGGARNELAKKGITVDVYATHVYQGVVNGGLDTGWQNGGRENISLNFDMGRLGLLPGGFLSLEGEGNYGEFVGAHQTGAIIPADNNLIFPNTDGPQFDLTQVLYTQFLSHNLALYAGKLDSLAVGDVNAFAHGKGDHQFLNTAFGFNPLISVAAPAYALSAGAMILPTGNPHELVLTATVQDMEGQSSTSGFDTALKGGTSFVGQGRYTTHFFDLTGHQLLGVIYSDRLYTSVDQNLHNFIIPGLPIQKHSGSWAVYYNFDQYLNQPDHDSDRGLGIFGRFGISDGEANPIHHFASFGVGGKGLIPGRTNDEFGVGYYWLGASNSTAFDQLNFGDSQGFEAYYDIAITPWMRLTPDVQVIDPSQQNVDTSVVLGLRLTMEF